MLRESSVLYRLAVLRKDLSMNWLDHLMEDRVDKNFHQPLLKRVSHRANIYSHQQLLVTPSLNFEESIKPASRLALQAAKHSLASLG